MIRRVEIRNYRCLRDVSVDLGNFHVVVGPNGAGKSTFFDCLQFVSDVLNYGVERAVYGEPKFDLKQRARNPRELTWMGKGEDIQIAITCEAPCGIHSPNRPDREQCRYELEVSVESGPQILAERLFLIDSETVGEAETGMNGSSMHRWDIDETTDGLFAPSEAKSLEENPHCRREGLRLILLRSGLAKKVLTIYESVDRANVSRLEPFLSALSSLPEGPEKLPVASWISKFLSDEIRTFALLSDVLSNSSAAGLHDRLYADGSNLPWMIDRLIQKRPGTYREWLDHIRTAVPDISGIDTYEREEDHHRHLKLTFDSGLVAPSWTVSGGTLCLLALTLFAYESSAPAVTFVEEPENGIHPQAIETVYQSLSSVWEKQVFCATHSPIFLGLAKPQEVLCFRRDEEGAVSIVRGDQHPRLKDWQEALTLGEFFAEGMLS